MAVSTLTCTAVSVRQAKPGYAYGATATLPITAASGAAQRALVRVGMPSDIPANATVTSALLTFTQSGVSGGGTGSMQLGRNTAAWTVSKATYTNRPASAAPVSAGATGSQPDGTLYTWDVTSDVQGFLAGTLTNYGWQLSNLASPIRNIRGSAASTGKPQLVITYLTPTDAPINLTPSGNQAVSLAKPWLTFQAPPDTTAIDVQIDADMNSPYDFDSGDVASSVGALDTSTTAWAGLTAGGASLYWRARTKSSLGYSAFSSWAQMRRVAKPTVTITSPTASSDDTTPPVVWSVAGGVQQAWQVIITNSKGQVLADSGRIVGTDTTWTPPKAVTTEGSSATVEVRIWDNVDRVATSSDPTYANAVLTFTAAGTASVGPATGITVTVDGTRPLVTITATRGSAPDSWTVLRDNVRIATGLSPASANLAAYQDWTADPNKPHVYRAAPYTNGTGTASGGPTQTVTPTCLGIWLVDPADPTKLAVIWGDDGGSFDATELAVIHQPIGGPAVRRVAYRPPLSGAINGDLIDVGSFTADAQIAALYDFKANSRDLRLVLGDRNLVVRIGDLLIAPTPESDSDRHSLVSFSWWQQDAPPWSP
jgi:hypothetical protein